MKCIAYRDGGNRMLLYLCQKDLERVLRGDLAESVFGIEHDRAIVVRHDLALFCRRNGTGKQTIYIHRQQHHPMRAEILQIGFDQSVCNNSGGAHRNTGSTQQIGRQIRQTIRRD